MAAECRVFTDGVAGKLRLEDKPMKDRWIGRDRHQENCALLFMLDRYKTLLYISKPAPLYVALPDRLAKSHSVFDTSAGKLC